MARAATNLFEAESFIGMTLGARTDKTGRSIQILSKAFPFATLALNIRIASIAIDATSTHGIFLKVEDFRIWHPIQNLPHRPDSSTFGADQGPDSSTTFSCYRFKVMGGTDKTSRWLTPKALTERYPSSCRTWKLGCSHDKVWRWSPIQGSRIRYRMGE